MGLIQAPLSVFVGFDPDEAVAWHVFVHSVFSRSSIPIAFTPLHERNLSRVFWRERDPLQSTTFSLSRFLVPTLCGFEGLAIYFDCDMLLRTDIANLIAEVERDPGKAIYVVKHEYVPSTTTKFLGKPQHRYPRKNWSSVIVWDCAHPSNRLLSAELVNHESPAFLHRFSWLRDDEIGSLRVEWNWLIGEYTAPTVEALNLHWTIGGPYFMEYGGSDAADEWFEEFRLATYCRQNNQGNKPE